MSLTNEQVMDFSSLTEYWEPEVDGYTFYDFSSLTGNWEPEVDEKGLPPVIVKQCCDNPNIINNYVTVMGKDIQFKVCTNCKKEVTNGE